MNVYICTDHDSHYVGGASIVIAESESQGRKYLDAMLKQHGLKPYEQKHYTLAPVKPDVPGAIVLRDGDY